MKNEFQSERNGALTATTGKAAEPQTVTDQAVRGDRVLDDFREGVAECAKVYYASKQ